MKKIYVLLFPFIALAACRKDHASTPSTNPANYELVAYSDHYNGSVADSVALNYTSGHLLNSYSVFVYGGAATDTSTYQVVYGNKEVTRINIVSLTYASYYNYYYNAGNRLDTIKWYTGDNATPTQSWAFTYNAAGRISDEYIYRQAALQDHVSFIYDALGNVLEQVDSSTARDVAADTVWYSNYDDKVNPLTAMPGFPKSVAPLPAFDVQFFSSPNNYGTLAQSVEIAPGQFQTKTTNLTYQYNVAGLPTAIINGLDTVRLTYKQY
jgi:hypothetical protein